MRKFRLKQIYLVMSQGGTIYGYSGQRRKAIGLAQRTVDRHKNIIHGKDAETLLVVKGILTTIKEVGA